MKKLFLAIAAVVAIGAVVTWQSMDSALAAPDVAFTDLNGHTVTTQDLRGKVVLVKFWATSCTTCVAQMPDTIRHYQELKSRGFDTIGVAMQYDPPNYVKNFTETRQLPFPVVIDAQGKIARAFGDVRLTPTAFLIDKQGRIIKRYLGNYDEKAFMATVEQALAS
ncbi:peroxiredoxin family protein [Castellaniella defragrans]|uniref:Cytochrome c-type biogenesis protein ResA n=1 Tax=Castellaniella defragrans (strain DSM 12143 / CCUG 39792 / 65Phen) TaxID=1437824 RepID=W8WUD9_CASD6|nr:TlpA disulfide reductase family protein [Castellaniella defragrans]CDM23144.1 Cytochrome c-type biogenesis protein ResA [Castellaniella defragrans 65Phen]